MNQQPQSSDIQNPVAGPPLSLDELGNEIAELSAHIHAATYRLLTLVREFDEREGWATGFCSCAHWLNWRTGLNKGAAREKVRVARALGDLPVISEAMRRGEVSYSKVRALTRGATPENEEELLIFAQAGTASHVETLVRAWRKVDRWEELEEAEKRHQHRYARAYTDEDGMLVLRARLEPEVGAVVMRALKAAADVLYRETEDGEKAGDKEVSGEQKRADALGLVAESALKGELDNGSRGDRYQVVVHVDAEALEDPDQPGQSVLEDGIRVSAETSRRLACDAAKVVMTHGPDGSVLDVGRKTRTIPPALRRALTHRDRSCRFPGCGLKFCDAHHIEHWAEGGKTKLDNLLLLCRYHHRVVHEGGIRVKMLPDGEPRFSRADGRPIPVAPVPPVLAEDPIAQLEQRHREEGLEIDAETTCPSWDGGSWDLNWALYCLRSIGKPKKRSRGNVRPFHGAHPTEQHLDGCDGGLRNPT
ncbi:MAG: DUF222 domain-containing protein [Thermoanaerobaculia bacterium]